MFWIFKISAFEKFRLNLYIDIFMTHLVILLEKIVKVGLVRKIFDATLVLKTQVADVLLVS